MRNQKIIDIYFNKKHMGQKINPNVLRLCHTKNYDSVFVNENYGDKLFITSFIHDLVNLKIDHCGCRIVMEDNKAIIQLKVDNIMKLQKGKIAAAIKKQILRKFKLNTVINVDIGKKRFENSLFIAKEICNRLKFSNRGYGKFLEELMKMIDKEEDVIGYKIKLKGRLGGAEKTQTEHYSNGSVPVQKISAKIDYANQAALCKGGIISVRVWIYKK